MEATSNNHHLIDFETWMRTSKSKREFSFVKCKKEFPHQPVTNWLLQFEAKKKLYDFEYFHSNSVHILACIGACALRLSNWLLKSADKPNENKTIHMNNHISNYRKHPTETPQTVLSMQPHTHTHSHRPSRKSKSFLFWRREKRSPELCLLYSVANFK